jgi:S-adenosylmethionine synthetase
LLFLSSFKIKTKNPNNTVGKLYNLLVSDDVASTIVAPDVQDWDSSTVSSGLENDIESPETGVSYYRSASGFHVRI